jgi:hypothetical protein
MIFKHYQELEIEKLNIDKLIDKTEALMVRYDISDIIAKYIKGDTLSYYSNPLYNGKSRYTGFILYALVLIVLLVSILMGQKI